MATVRNERKLAAVSTETPEGSRSSGAQNVLDPGSAQDYISQVSEEIEGRVTKKLSKEFSKTESRILGALSKLDELLLNPQVWTCSVTVPGTSRNNNSENRETTGDRSSDDTHPEVGFFSHHSGQLNNPESENHPRNVDLFARVPAVLSRYFVDFYCGVEQQAMFHCKFCRKFNFFPLLTIVRNARKIYFFSFIYLIVGLPTSTTNQLRCQ